MTTAPFDLRHLLRLIDAERTQQGLSWAALSAQTGVATSTIRRFGHSEDAEADGVLALVRWLGLAPEHFVDASSVDGQPLAPPGDGIVRVDMELVAQANGDRGGARGRTRTTIQRLVEVAQRTSRTVASLTRISEI